MMCSYFAIVSPLTSLPCTCDSQRQRRTCRVIVCTWLVPLVVASPYLYSASYPFTIHSHLGTVSRLICADRFDEIDGGGQFRRAFFLFLFVFVYVVPLALIGGTCARTAAALRRQSSAAVTPSTPYNTAIVVHKRDENRRKVNWRIKFMYIYIDFISPWREQQKHTNSSTL